MAGLIVNRGEKWSRSDVFWGRRGPNNKGKLLGSHDGTTTDFRNQIGVYALYDRQGDLIYVGETTRESLFSRLWSHCNDPGKQDYTHFSWWGLRYVRNDGTLSNPAEQKLLEVRTLIKHLEATLIAATRPRANQYSGWWVGNVEAYQQVRDSRLGAPGVTPPDPSREADEETEAEKAGKVEPELATAGDIEVEVGKRWWRRAAVIVFALLGWLVAFLPLLASR